MNQATSRNAKCNRGDRIAGKAEASFAEVNTSTSGTIGAVLTLGKIGTGGERAGVGR